MRHRVAGVIGIGAGAVHLFVLPWGHVTALRSLSLAILLPCAALVWYRSTDRRLPLTAAFAFWLGIACLSLASTRDFDASVAAIRGEVLRSFAVFFSFFVLARELPAFRVWVAATAASFAALSLLAIVSYASHQAWVSFYVPSLGDFVSGVVTVLPTLAAAFLVRNPADRSDRWLAGLIVAAAAGSLVAGYLTQSRALWWVLASGDAVVTALYVWKMRRASIRIIAAAVIIFATALALTVRVASERGGDVTAVSVETRTPLYATVITKIAANPWRGTGYGHETDRAWYEAKLPDSSLFHPHNIVLGYADQMGMLGLVVLAILFGSLIAAFARPLRNGGPTEFVLALAGLTLVAMVFIRNNVDAYFVKQNLWLFFAHAGLLLGQIRRVAGPAGRAAGGMPGEPAAGRRS